MDINKLSNRYLVFSIISTLLIPFTGVVALSYAVRAKLAMAKGGDNDGVETILDLCQKWLNITLILFAIIFPLLVLFFFLLPIFS